MLALSAWPSTGEHMHDLAEPPVATSSSTIQAVVAGTRLTVVEGGSERLKLLLRLIDGAQVSVRLLFYMMDADAAGEAVRDALVLTGNPWNSPAARLAAPIPSISWLPLIS